MLLFEGFLQIGKEKSVYRQLRRGHQWQKFVKVFAEVKAALMQIVQGGGFN